MSLHSWMLHRVGNIGRNCSYITLTLLVYVLSCVSGCSDEICLQKVCFRGIFTADAMLPEAQRSRTFNFFFQTCPVGTVAPPNSLNLLIIISTIDYKTQILLQTIIWRLFHYLAANEFREWWMIWYTAFGNRAEPVFTHLQYSSPNIIISILKNRS